MQQTFRLLILLSNVSLRWGFPSEMTAPKVKSLCPANHQLPSKHRPTMLRNYASQVDQLDIILFLNHANSRETMTHIYYQRISKYCHVMSYQKILTELHVIVKMIGLNLGRCVLEILQYWHHGLIFIRNF